MYADNVIRSLRLTVSARGSNEVSTDVARQNDGPPQYRVVRETNGRPVLKVRVSLFCNTWLRPEGQLDRGPCCP